MKAYQYFLLLSICLWIRVNGDASIDRQSERGRAATAKSVGHGREEKEAEEGRTKLSGESSERSLTSSRRRLGLDSEAIGSGSSRAEARSRRRIKGADDDELSGGYLTYDFLYDDENSQVPSASLEPHRQATRKRKHRRNRCKKRPGCQQRNKNKRDRNRKKNNRRKNREEIAAPRKWFELQTALSNPRNFETQVFVGNRSLALFRQELAAAAARAAQDTSRRPIDRYIDESLRDYEKIPVVTRLRRTHSSAKNLKRKISSKNRDKPEKAKKNEQFRERKEKEGKRSFKGKRKDDKKSDAVVEKSRTDDHENIQKNVTGLIDEKVGSIVQILRE